MNGFAKNRRRPRHGFRHIALLLLAAAIQAPQANAVMGMDDPLTRARFGESLDGGWVFSQQDGRCQLERHPVAYGTARFTTDLSGRLVFELVGLRDLLAPGPVAWRRQAPQWHPLYPLAELVGQLHHVTGVGVSAQDVAATRMLMDLYAGFHQIIHNPGFYDGGSTVQVQLSAVNFRAAYRRFMACYQGGGERLTSFATLEKTRVLFPVDQHRLDEQAMPTLSAVARLVKADPQINKVFIDGHTDNSGGERHNVGLSKRRAEAVVKYLRALGVPSAKLVIRYHAHRYPIASNATEAGKRQNRRTTVRLDRGAATVAVN